jgi:signal transduction histidine kinase
MIEQILEFTRLRVGGGIPVTPRAVDLYDVLRAAIEEVRSSFPARAIDARFEGNGRGSWDADRLSQVFSNLMGNAITYGDPTQPIQVTVGDDQGDVVIEVSNAGPVIPADVLPLIFDPFRRGGEVRSNATKGLGLGLYITRQIVVAHGGTIGVQSADGVTTFRISMPRREGLVVR